MHSVHNRKPLKRSKQKKPVCGPVLRVWMT